MKAFSALVLMRIPPESLFIAMRDRLGEIAPALADIDSIIEVERTQTPDGLHVVNRWHARQHVPALLRARLGTNDIAWIDRAIWFEKPLMARWSIEPSIGDGAIACTGTTRFEPAMAGRGSRALFEGELTIEPKFLASIVGPFEKPVRSLVESIATTLIPANFRAAAEAAARLA